MIKALQCTNCQGKGTIPVNVTWNCLACNGPGDNHIGDDEYNSPGYLWCGVCRNARVFEDIEYQKCSPCRGQGVIYYSDAPDLSKTKKVRSSIGVGASQPKNKKSLWKLQGLIILVSTLAFFFYLTPNLTIDKTQEYLDKKVIFLKDYYYYQKNRIIKIQLSNDIQSEHDKKIRQLSSGISLPSINPYSELITGAWEGKLDCSGKAYGINLLISANSNDRNGLIIVSPFRRKFPTNEYWSFPITASLVGNKFKFSTFEKSSVKSGLKPFSGTGLLISDIVPSIKLKSSDGVCNGTVNGNVTKTYTEKLIKIKDGVSQYFVF